MLESGLAAPEEARDPREESVVCPPEARGAAGFDWDSAEAVLREPEEDKAADGLAAPNSDEGFEAEDADEPKALLVAADAPEEADSLEAADAELNTEGLAAVAAAVLLNTPLVVFEKADEAVPAVVLFDKAELPDAAELFDNPPELPADVNFLLLSLLEKVITAPKTQTNEYDLAVILL